jgi:hypothetical protein
VWKLPLLTSLPTAIGSLNRYTTYPSSANQWSSLLWPIAIGQRVVTWPKASQSDFFPGSFENFAGKRRLLPSQLESFEFRYAPGSRKEQERNKKKMRQQARILRDIGWAKSSASIQIPVSDPSECLKSSILLAFWLHELLNNCHCSVC